MSRIRVGCWSVALISLLVVPGGLWAESKDLGKAQLTSKMIEEIQGSFRPSPAEERLIDAVVANPIKEVALNQDVLRNHNTLFSHEIKTANITDQKSTGRCWLYAALNVLRPAVLEKIDDSEFEFSQNYLYFWDKMEKANTSLENFIERAGLDLRDEKFRRILRNPVEDGGYWQTFTNLCRKYGAVPRNAMPETNSTENSRMMNRLIIQRLRLAAYEMHEMKATGASDTALRKEKTRVLADVYRMLVFHLGVPPTEFEFRYKPKQTDAEKDEGEKEESTVGAKETEIITKRYTPRSFAEEFIFDDLDDFVMVANWPSRDYGVLYEVALTRNVMEGEYLNFLNVTTEDMKDAVLKSVLGGDPVDISADVTHQGDRESGILNSDLYEYGEIYGVDLSGSKKIKGALGIVNSTHGMVIMGVDMVDKDVVKWKVENSWGTDNGDKGWYYLYDNWFDDFVVRAVVKKKHLPKRLLALYDQKPTFIPEEEPEQ
jgi:bleomycin hydrolase